ncbi:MAG: hypothetical protein JWL77_1333, partial [Chthonomonadaceae bacterium]|nr:hypothetical protein [Chthonomonadaceae bacterium]
MLLIIGGAARTGKSILSRRLLLETHQPYLSLDVLKMGLVNGLPSFGLDPEASAIAIAEQLWPLVKAMAVNMVETDVHYTIEGEILPKHADELALRFPKEVRAGFLGYADIVPRQKLAEIRKFGGHPNDWLTDYPDEDILELVEQNVEFSRYLQKECRRLGIPYFDTSESFDSVQNRVFT